MEGVSFHAKGGHMKSVLFFLKVLLHTVICADARRGSWENEVISAFRLGKFGCIAAMNDRISFSKWYTVKFAKHEMQLTHSQRQLAKRMGWSFDEFIDRYSEQVSPARFQQDLLDYPNLAELVRKKEQANRTSAPHKVKRRKSNSQIVPAGMVNQSMQVI